MMDEPIVLGVFEELWRANARVRLPDTVIWKYGKVRLGPPPSPPAGVSRRRCHL